MQRSIGIDLGTTHSVASHILGGKPAVIHYRDDKDADLTLFPSVVSRAGTGETLYGYTAIRNSAVAPAETLYSIKRLMGLNFDNANVQDVRHRVPYTICPADDPADIGARVMFGGRKLTPIEVSAMIVRRLTDLCSERLGPIGHATITVPAMFAESQRNATREAGVQAGLTLRPILDEPVAASLAFGFGKDKSDHRLLVYDLGGGTFDVSLVQISGDNLQGLARNGDMWLGGDDFDQLIVKRIEDWIAHEYRDEGTIDFTAPAIRRLLKSKAEEAKIKLSTHPEWNIVEPDCLQTPSGRYVQLDLVVTRREFEGWIRPLVQRSMDMVESVLQQNSLEPRHLTAVLLAGGSTLVPLVRETLESRFGPGKVRHDIDPMHCVSLGAALWNEKFPIDQKSGKLVTDNLRRIVLTTERDFGIECFYDGNPHYFEPIIPRGSVYPTAPNQFRKRFRPTANNQRKFRIPIFQGNGLTTIGNACQGIFHYEAPRPVPLHSSIFVTFNMDLHGILTMDVELDGDPASRRQFEIDRNREVLDERTQARLAQWKEDLEKLLRTLQNFRRDYNSYLTDAERTDIDAIARDVERVIAENRREDCQPVRGRLLLALTGSGVASDLFMGLRAQESADPMNAKLLGRTMTQIRKTLADEQKVLAGELPGDAATLRNSVDSLRNTLKTYTNLVFSAQSGSGQESGEVGGVAKG